MEAASRKRARPGNNSFAADRLSDLPDALLHDILSFLKARQVVQTSVLSKRWRHLWRSVPCLDIDDREFISTAGLSWSEEYNYQCTAAGQNDREKFEDFTDNLLAHQNGSLLDTFQMHIGKGKCHKRIDASRWIRRGLKCAPEVLCYHDNYIFVGPMPNLDSTSCCLRKLHLHGVKLHESFSEHISSVCTLVEIMELKSCHLCFHKITLPALKNLVIDNCSVDFNDDKNNDELSIMAPHLSHLHLVLYVNTEKLVSVNAMPSLIAVHIAVFLPPRVTALVGSRAERGIGDCEG